MKKLKKWLVKPQVQRTVYLLALFLWIAINYHGGNLANLTTPSTFGPPVWLFILPPIVLLGLQLWLNNVWIWRFFCGLLILFTFWIASISVRDIARPFEALQPLIWNVGAVGFLIVLVFVLAFANWVLLNMKPKK